LSYVSGCDSGFGQALAQELDSIGVDVFAGCLCTSSDGAKQLLSSCSQRCDIMSYIVYCNSSSFPTCYEI